MISKIRVILDGIHDALNGRSRRVNRLFYGQDTPPPPRPLWFRILNTVMIMLFICILTINGAVYGYFWGTGTLPTFTGDTTQTLLPPEVPVSTTPEEVMAFIEDDDTNLNRYEIGFNCVEYAFLMAREAHWQGMPASVIEIAFGEDTGHLILGFPTADGDWILVNPQTDSIIKPRIGGMLGGKMVTGINILNWYVTRTPMEVNDETTVQ